MPDDKIKLGVLWKHVSREGKQPYLSGRVQQEGLDAAVELLRSGGRLLVLSNKKRPDKRDPDCVLFVVPEADRREHQATPPATTPTDQGRSVPRPGARPGR